MRYILVIILAMSVVLQGCVPVDTTQGGKNLAPKDFLKAVEHYDKILRDAIEKEQAAIAFRQETEAKFTQAKIELVTDYLHQAAAIAADNNKNSAEASEEAIILLEKIKQWDDKDSRLAKQMAIYSEEKSRLDAAYAQIDQQFNDYKFDEAVKSIALLLQERPSNIELLAKKQSAEQLNSIYSTLNSQIKGRELEKAAETAKLLAQALPPGMSYDKSSIKKELMGAIRDKADALTQKNKFSLAVSFLEQFNLPELEEQIAAIKSSGSDSYYIRAVKEDKSGNPFLSYLLLNKALSFQDKAPGSKEREAAIFALQKKTNDDLEKSLQEYIAIASFDSPEHDRDAGMQFSDSLTSYLYNKLPYGINILERDKIDFILKEKQQEKDLGKVLGANLVVTGRVSLFSVEAYEDKGTATAKVVTGEQTVPNPAYIDMVTRYGNDTKKWPSVPSPTTVTQTYQMISYTKGTAHLKGFAKVSIRIFDTSRGTISFVQDYPANIEDSSEFQDEVKEANIPYIPKKLMSTIEAKAAMREKIVAEIAEVVLSSFNQREVRFLNLAKLMIDRREPNKAIAPLAKGYYYCQKVNIPVDNSIFVEITRLIDTILDK